jgi:hypothetical protein
MNNEGADVLRMLIEKGADISPRDPRNGRNALDIAEFWERGDIIQVLKDAPRIRRRADAALYQVKHVKIAARQEQLKARAARFRLKVGPGP